MRHWENGNNQKLQNNKEVHHCDRNVWRRIRHQSVKNMWKKWICKKLWQSHSGQQVEIDMEQSWRHGKSKAHGVRLWRECSDWWINESVLKSAWDKATLHVLPCCAVEGFCSTSSCPKTTFYVAPKVPRKTATSTGCVLIVFNAVFKNWYIVLSEVGSPVTINCNNNSK